MIDFACIFFGDVTRRLIIRLGFLLDLFIYLFFLQFFFIINPNLHKRGATLSEWAGFW